MKGILMAVVGVASAITFSPAAFAEDFVPGDPEFQVFGDITNGPVSATIGRSGILEGDFTDYYRFTIDQDGTGSGSLSTSTSALLSATDLDIISVMVNGLAATKTLSADGKSEFFDISSVPIAFGVLNTIEIVGFSRGNGSYGGNATFLPNAIPEPATWAMMITGFGLVGYGARRQRWTLKAAKA
ncbi:PEP-CTERM protein-sorting domain-containing protein [Sphingomonas laterariae]|uniref:PEP-CTERM protein-sorting domain-containing protein n=1 Tax=Edaphosphingomonas laterariae TaxID=861865 RepID=A0A239DL32_9SPHN|nr:FxDxF family PEP-CTERM protein [Sphingomonas laterariae]SNS33170.1 PEP-CTERM protein-sorting domain-containing protein [Sphingomonas laterariae]